MTKVPSCVLTFLLIVGCSDKSTNTIQTHPSLPKWERVNGPSSRISVLAVSGQTVIAGSDSSKVFVSHDEGSNWTVTNLDPEFLPSRYVSAILVTHSGQILVGSSGQRGFKSVDNGRTWSPAFASLPDTAIFSIAYKDSVLVVGTFRAIYRSTNDGTTWSIAMDSAWARSMAADISGNLYASINDRGVYQSANNGAQWSVVRLLFSSPKLWVDGSGFVWFIDYNGAYRTTDGGRTWQNTISFLAGGTCLTMNSQAHVFVGHMWGVRVSFDGGNTWMYSTSDSLTYKAVTELGVGVHDRVFAATTNHGLYRTLLLSE